MLRRFEEREPRPYKPKMPPAWRETKPKPPSQSTGVYQVVFVRRGGTTKVWRTTKAPRTEWMLECGKNNAALFVVRYWPSKKGWRVLDMREAQSFTHQQNQWGKNRYVTWTGHRMLETIFPSEDAAVMAAISLSGY